MSNFEYQKFLLEGKIPEKFTAAKLVNFIIKNYNGQKTAAMGMNSKYNEWDVKQVIVPSTDKLFADLKAAGWLPDKNLRSTAHGYKSPTDPHGGITASKKPDASKNRFILTVSASKKDSHKTPSFSVYD